jgi:hypothetical protein
MSIYLSQVCQLINRKHRERRKGVPSSTVLEQVHSELYNRHPAPGGDMHGTNNLDVVLRNTIRPDSPPRIGHTFIRHVLPEEQLNR